MLVPAGSPIFFLRVHRMLIDSLSDVHLGCRVVTLSLRQLLWILLSYTVIHVECVFIAHILRYILHKYWIRKRNSISPFYDVYNCL